MFDSIGLTKLLRVVLYVNAALATALATDLLGILPRVPLLSAVSISVIAVSGLLFVVGETRLFPWLCRLPVIWQLFPNIDGEYAIEISSNWSVVEARHRGREPEISAEGEVTLLKRIGKAKIAVRLSQIDMSVTMDDEYLRSETVTCSLRKDKGERWPALFYVYDSHVSAPKNTDSQRHLGAARVSIPLERRPAVLKGNYWTDRNWHIGLNTAGRIRLRRISPANARSS